MFFNDKRGPFLPAFGLAEAGTLKGIPSKESKAEWLSSGFETLDRELFDPETCYDLMGAVGNSEGPLSERMGKMRKRERRLRFCLARPCREPPDGSRNHSVDGSHIREPALHPVQTPLRRRLPAGELTCPVNSVSTLRGKIHDQGI